MFLRALIAFLVIPGIVAFAVPIVWLWPTIRSQSPHPTGLLLITVGLFALIWCIRDFYISGKGTLAPWNPPENLVTVGLYRYTRNPMYISVMLILMGWTTAFESTSLLVYSAVMLLGFQLRVVYGEEPRLLHRFGEKWTRYAARVPRWSGRLNHRRKLKAGRI